MKKRDIWFMYTSNKEIVRNIFSVIAGVLVSSALYMLFGLILLIFIASKVKGHGEESGLEKISTSLDIASVIALFVCCLPGGFVTGKISTRKDMIHGAVTAIVSSILLASINNFEFNKESIVYYLVSILATIFGTSLAIKKKRKKLCKTYIPKSLITFYMKNIFSLIVSLMLFGISAYSQKDSTAKKPEKKIKQFWLVVLKTGPKDKEITDSTERSKIFAGHFSNMGILHSEGILKAAGPFGKNEFTWRGLFIFDCKTREEAENYVKTDPAVAAGIFIVDIVPWFSEPSGSFEEGKPKKKN